MGIKVLDVEVHGDGSRGSVLIESDLAEFPAQIEELTSSQARESVLNAASKKLTGSPGISRTSEPPYPVNAQGETIENLVDEDKQPLPPQHIRSQPAAYRACYEVTSRQ